MAIINGYATLAEFKALLGITSTNATDDSIIEDCIEAASRYIDGKTRRTFYARTETRYFSVPDGGERQLDLDDDLLTITTLLNGDGTTITNTYYHLVPKNSAPYYAILLKISYGYSWLIDTLGNSEYVISVAGTWGYCAVAPDDIKEACLQIALAAYKRKHGENLSSNTVTTGYGVMVTSQDVPNFAWQIINQYKKVM